MTWNLVYAQEFKDSLKTFAKDRELLTALDRKLERLREDPYSVGARLSGDLHDWHAARLVRTYRIFFKINDDGRVVTLGTIQHRRHAY